MLTNMIVRTAPYENKIEAFAQTNTPPDRTICAIEIMLPCKVQQVGVETKAIVFCWKNNNNPANPLRAKYITFLS